MDEEEMFERSFEGVDLERVFACLRCGALVPSGYTKLHQDWHRELEES